VCSLCVIMGRENPTQVVSEREHTPLSKWGGEGGLDWGPFTTILHSTISEYTMLYKG
jgi:hypothetical protein